MFDIGELVMYGSEGVCRISGICEENFGGASARYYELIPEYRANSSVLVPVDNEVLTAKMHPLLTKSELDALFDAIPDIPMQWIDNDNLRKERYKQMLSSGDRSDLICILKTLHQHRIDCVNRGRKLHAADERFFAQAADKLHSEIAAILGITPDEAESYVMNRMEKLS